MNRLVTIRDVAKWIGIEAVEVERWTREGRLPVAREGGMVGIEPAPLKRFLMQELAAILDRRRSGADELLARRVLATLCALESGDEPADDGAQATRRVLVVDDSEPMAELVARSLAGVRGRVECLRAADGVAACDILASRPVDLAVIDVLMPNMDGIALCRLIRESVRLAGVKILVISGLLGPETRRELTAIGVDGMLEKPFRSDTLAARVMALLYPVAVA